MIYKRSNNIDNYSDEREYRNYEKLDNLMIDINQVIADMTSRGAKRLVEDKIRMGDPQQNITEKDIKSIYKKGVLAFVYRFIEISETCERKYLDESYKAGEEVEKLR